MSIGQPPPSSIDGPSLVGCSGANVELSSGNIVNAPSYTWTVPNSTWLVNGIPGPSVTVAYTGPQAPPPNTWVSTRIITVGSNMGDGKIGVRANTAECIGNGFVYKTLTTTPGTISISGPSLICSSGTYVSAGDPGSVSWSSSNPSGLSINSSTGQATRVNNYSGQVTITATLNNACGSVPATTSPVLVGTGITDPLFEQKTVSCLSGNNTYTILGRVTASPDINAIYKWYIGTAARTNFVLKATTSGNSTTIPGDQADNLYHTLRVVITNSCGSIQTSDVEGRFKASCSGGGGGALRVSAFPNPATSILTIQVIDSLSENSYQDLDESYEVFISDRSSNKVYLSHSSKQNLEIPVGTLLPGVYYLNVTYRKTNLQKQIVIKR